jgi:hypothetical protein
LCGCREREALKTNLEDEITTRETVITHLRDM